MADAPLLPLVARVDETASPCHGAANPMETVMSSVHTSSESATGSRRCRPGR
jgi:hypothetical protein